MAEAYEVDLSQYISKEQQAQLIAEQNKRKARAKRPGQLPPTKRSKGRPRAHTQDDDQYFDDSEYPDLGDTEPVKGQEWRGRVRKEEQAWQASLEANKQLAQQYAAYDRDCSVQAQVDAALSCATQSLAGALVRHSCCRWSCLRRTESSWHKCWPYSCCRPLSNKTTLTPDSSSSSSSSSDGRSNRQSIPASHSRTSSPQASMCNRPRNSCSNSNSRHHYY